MDKRNKTAAEMLRELDERATKGPWRVDALLHTLSYGHSCDVTPEVETQLEVNARLIATLRNVLPELTKLMEEANLVRRCLNCGSRNGRLSFQLDALTAKLRQEAGDE